MIRHVEFSINFDLTCWGEKEDFEIDTEKMIEEDTIDFIINDTGELIDHLVINKVWYEEEEGEE